MRIFISASNDKREFKSELNNQFKQNENVILYYRNLMHEFKTINNLYKIPKVEAFLEKPDFVLILLSKAYLKDEWLCAELNALFVLEQSKTTKFIIPVLLDSFQENELPKYFRENKNEIIDISKLTEIDGAHEVAEEISKIATVSKSIFIGHGKSKL